ncbi:uncharacterized protein LOC105424891 [Pogonomyrmex barbatus]|uniref:Uncharacterized protein LOC105424891 n=1 Tax=Pogonomyrmex barbatus TaxID=144034 RepID=A0A6I9W1K3_9HYME|nr:uncharacterized protein LOC105424891 [Pogonomyrmex barbatus]XP_011633679.1 uncharacterized protein LOC105424891 [Pogonomyrmex barbatus]XP_011633680.1 uncharacterized protein LOC105424891 [Pogonomyrmex barbatus]
MEYTLEDAFDTLKDKKAEQKKNIEDLINKISNNEVFSLKSTSSLEDVKKKQNKFYESLKKEIQQVEPEDYPILRTSDIRVEVITEMEAEIHNMQELLSNLQQKLSDIQNDIKYLRNKEDGLKKLQESYLDIVKTLKIKHMKKEIIALTKRIFLQVKHDLSVVVDKIFPDNDGFKELLAALTSAYMKGGDDMYIDVTPNTLNYINFLLEADIIQYHRNDKTKIKMTELL